VRRSLQQGRHRYRAGLSGADLLRGYFDPAIGATCTLSTSADAVIAGAVKKGNGAVMQALRVRIDDAGANGVPDDSDDRIFATQGIFVP
jgi:hypothetical protein